MKDLRRQLDDEAAKRGVAFNLDMGGVVLDPARCYDCTKWGARPDACRHVDENVGVMVREAHRTGAHQVRTWSAETGWVASVGQVAMLYGDTMAEALAGLLLKLWQSSPIVAE